MPLVVLILVTLIVIGGITLVSIVLFGSRNEQHGAGDDKPDPDKLY